MPPKKLYDNAVTYFVSERIMQQWEWLHIEEFDELLQATIEFDNMCREKNNGSNNNNNIILTLEYNDPKEFFDDSLISVTYKNDPYLTIENG